MFYDFTWKKQILLQEMWGDGGGGGGLAPPLPPLSLRPAFAEEILNGKLHFL